MSSHRLVRWKLTRLVSRYDHTKKIEGVDQSTESEDNNQSIWCKIVYTFSSSRRRRELRELDG